VGSESDERNVLFPCPACGSPHILGEDTNHFQCRVCSHTTEFFLCRRCRVTFASQYQSSKDLEGGEASSGRPEWLECAGCGVVARIRAFRPGRLSGARADWAPTKRFYDRFGVDFTDAVQFSGRRVIFGEILLTTSLPDLERGVIMVSFDQDALHIHDGDGHQISYDRVRLIEIVGRDEVLASPPRDLVAVLAANALAAKPVSPSESILAVAWEDGSFIILNRGLRPEELAHALERYTSRLPH
jgi:hypothetical protein